MKVIEARELEQLVRRTFPGKHLFSAHSELGLGTGRPPQVTFVHGGPDPFLDSQFDAWVAGSPRCRRLRGYPHALIASLPAPRSGVRV